MQKGTVVEYNKSLHFPRITVHGRFQPPLHRQHWEYIEKGFSIADRLTVLITNPVIGADATEFTS